MTDDLKKKHPRRRRRRKKKVTAVPNVATDKATSLINLRSRLSGLAKRNGGMNQ